MEVILFENVATLGSQGAVVSVSPGYYRNFLAPRKLAVEATEANKKSLQDKVKRLNRQAEAEKKAARGEAEKLGEVTLTFRLRAGEEDKLFGSVTNADIAEELAKAGYTIDRHSITIEEPIKRLGLYTVDVRMHHEVTAKVKVLVEKAAE
jgi:large subunit ribosomal protein L9